MLVGAPADAASPESLDGHKLLQQVIHSPDPASVWASLSPAEQKAARSATLTLHAVPVST
jgi:hypothetical protein